MIDIRDTDNTLYGYYDDFSTLQFGENTWYGANEEALQVCRWAQHAGHKAKCHKHKYRPRETTVTQETFIVVSGTMHLTLHSEDKQRIVFDRDLPAGSIVLLYRGWHFFSVVENGTVAFEAKNGPFTGVAADKDYFDAADQPHDH